MVELLEQFSTSREHHQQRAWEHGGPTLLKDHKNARPSPCQWGSPSPNVISFYRQAGASPLQAEGAAALHQLTRVEWSGVDQEPAGRSGRIGTLDQSQEGDQGLITGGGGTVDQGAVTFSYTTGTRTPVSSRWVPST
jgi:hypothetical protein